MVKQEEGWVVCRAFKKRTTTVPTKRRQLWDPNCFLYDDATLLEPLDKNVLTKRAKHNTDGLAVTPFKQELPFEANQIVDDGLFGSMYLKSMGDDELSQLPQLESPSLASEKLSETISRAGEDEVGAEKRMTDWRALDKFVASQFLMSGEE